MGLCPANESEIEVRITKATLVVACAQLSAISGLGVKIHVRL